MAPALFVPIHLDAIIVKEDTYVRRSMANFTELPYVDRISSPRRDVNPNTPYLSDSILAQAFQDQDLPLKKGLHLHWALPDGLTKTMGLAIVRKQQFLNVFGDDTIWKALLAKQWLGVEKAGLARVLPRQQRLDPGISAGQLPLVEQMLAQSTFPPVPNRWALFRDYPGYSDSWIIESDYLFSEADARQYQSDIGSIAYPVSNKEGAPFRYMGRRVPLAGWQEQSQDEKQTKRYLADPLSAIGYGEPTFAAFYPNCFSVFGFYDAFFELGKKATAADLNPLKYTLFGWYSDRDRDYLSLYLADFVTRYQQEQGQAPTIEVQCQALEREFGWTLSPQPATMPERVVCYGQLKFALDSKQKGEVNTAVSATADVRVAIGNTGTEAMATFLAEAISEGQPLASVTTHLEAARLAGQLGRQLLDVGPRFQEAHHNQGFTAVSSGTLWTIRQQSSTTQSADAAAAHEANQITLPAELAHWLDDLNQHQQAYDRAWQEIASLREQIFGDWTKYMLTAYPPAYDTDISYDINRLQYFIEQGDIRQLNNKIAATGLLRMKKAADGLLLETSTDQLDPALTFTDFSQAASALQLAGPASITDGKISFTTGEGQFSAVWFKEKCRVDQPFTLTFQFRIEVPAGAGGADGMAFVIQNSSLTPTIYGPAGTLGYAGIANSLAVEFDTYLNEPFQDPDNNHISVQSRGRAPNSVDHQCSLGELRKAQLPQLNGGQVHTVTLTYVPGQLTLVFNHDQTLVVPVDLTVLLDVPDGTAWFGFTAATGGYWQKYELLNCSFAYTSVAEKLSQTLNRILKALKSHVAFANFTAVADLELVGSASAKGGKLQLQPQAPANATAAWFTRKQFVANGFTTSFTFQGEQGKDLAFVFSIQNNSLYALADPRRNISFFHIPQSVGIGFSAYAGIGAVDAGWSPTIGESRVLGDSRDLPNFADGKEHTATITYSSGQVKVTLDDNQVVAFALDLAQQIHLDNGWAWVGFASAGAGSDLSIGQQDILSWSFERPGQYQYELLATAAPRYWQPSEPVVLLTGNDATYSERHGQDGRLRDDGLLNCTAVTDVSIPAVPKADFVQNLPQSLTDTGLPQGAPADQPHFGVNTWQDEWHAFLVEWRVNLFPTLDPVDASLGHAYAPSYIMDNYGLPTDQVDLVPQLRTLQEQFRLKDFSSLQNLRLVGNASQFGNTLRLTPSMGMQKGAAWYTIPQPVSGPFTTTFQFQITNQGNSGADGIAFVIQNNKVDALGEFGGGIGYHGIPNSLAVEFDTYNDTGLFSDPDGDHISIQSRGRLPNSSHQPYSLGQALVDQLPNFADGQVHTVTIDYYPGRLSVSIDKYKNVVTAAVDLASLLDLADGKAWIGLTSASGAAWENHDILSWSFAVRSKEFTPGKERVIGDPRPYTGVAILTPQAGKQLRIRYEQELVRLIKPYLLAQFMKNQNLNTEPTDAELIGKYHTQFESWGKFQEPRQLWQSLPVEQDAEGKQSLTNFQQVQKWLLQYMGSSVPDNKTLTFNGGIAAWYIVQHQPDSASADNDKLDVRQGMLFAAAFTMQQDIDNAYAAYKKALSDPDPQAEEIATTRTAWQKANEAFAALSLAYAYQTLHQTPALSQALSGFNQALLGRRQALQLPVADPLGFAADQTFAAKVATAVGDANRTASLPYDMFTPVRAGQMDITGLRLVDTFGRIKEVPEDVLAKITVPPVLQVDSKHEVHLPPRLAQPARLNLRWLSADFSDVEVNAHPATSPVCGWLLPNNLDNSLMVYDQVGQPLGALLANDTTRPWHSAPGHEPLAIEEIINPSLQAVVRQLADQQARSLTDGTRFLDHFISAVDTALTHISPESFAAHQGRALLMSRPIAVVRVQVGLELQGLPINDSAWSAFGYDLARFEQALAQNEPVAKLTRRTGAFEQVKVPIRLGEFQQLNDGLVGYWHQQADGQLNHLFYALQSDPIDNDNIVTRTGQTAVDQETFHIHLSASDAPQTLVALMDPRGTLHATCGLLPSKTIDIPSEQYAAALESIQITFLTTPLLTAADRIEISVPQEPGYAWSWLGKEGDHWREVNTIGTLRHMAVQAAFASSSVNPDDVWQALLTAGWLVPLTADEATVTPIDQRTQAKLPQPFAALAPKIEALLAQSHLNRFKTTAAQIPKQVIREGWLKLRPTEEHNR